MQLEKATSGGGEAGLAGWISSNDVTLITMVLVVIIALFLHANLIKGQSENEQQATEIAGLEQDLAETRRRLDEVRGQREAASAALQDTRQELDRTGQTLQVTRQERDQRQRELAEALRRIAALDASIAALTTEKQDLTETRVQLESERRKLVAEGSALTQAKTSLEEQVAAMTAQLAERVEALEALQRQRDRLKQDADKLAEVLAAFARLKADNAALATSNAGATAAMAEAEARAGELQKKVTAEAARADDYLSRLRRAAELFKNMQAQQQNLQQQLGDADRRFQKQLAMETTVNRQLVGLNGPLRRVAILFDASGSMKEKSAGGDDRWAEAQKIATTWLGHLDVDQCVLIVFSSSVRTFPEDGSLVDIRGPQGDVNREALMAKLRAVEPAGSTNTLDALRKAYSYEGIDTILLFSDGAPTAPNSARFDERLAQQIYTLCRQHPDVPVNTVGLGNYFDPSLSTFLRTVARLTGGTFRGR